MKPERPLTPAGLAAGHCDALFRQRAEPADLLPEFGRLGERLARRLGPVLAGFGGGKAPEIRVVGVERTNGAELAAAIGPLAANSLLAAGASPHRLLFSIDGAALLAQLDRAFGGTGEIGKLPETLPLSADLLAQRVEQGIAELLTQLIDPSEPLRIAERDSSYATLSPFRRGGDALAVLALHVTESGGPPMTLRLAAKVESLAALLPSGETRKRPPARRAGPLDEPFADIELTLEAVLTEMRLPLSRIASLAPGQTLPIAVARAVPLRVGGTVVARGTVGELDDRVALQITHALHSRKESL